MRTSNTYPRISVVTPCLNQVKYIESTIKSIIDQRYPNMEYIIVDGGSTDGTLDVVRQYENEIALWISEADTGPYDAINKGFKHSTGDIMAWLNGDDIYMPYTLKTVGEAFLDCGGVDWITTAFPLGIDECGAIDSFVSSPFCRKWFEYGWHLDSSKYFKAWIMQESTFWRRRLWQTAGSQLDVSYSLAADYELWSRFWQISEMALFKFPLACIRHHPKQRSADYDTYVQEALRVWNREGKSFTFLNRLQRKIVKCLEHVHPVDHFKDNINWLRMNDQKKTWCVDVERIIV